MARSILFVLICLQLSPIIGQLANTNGGIFIRSDGLSPPTNNGRFANYAVSGGQRPRAIVRDYRRRQQQPATVDPNLQQLYEAQARAAAEYAAQANATGQLGQPGAAGQNPYLGPGAYPYGHSNQFIPYPYGYPFPFVSISRNNTPSRIRERLTAFGVDRGISDILGGIFGYAPLENRQIYPYFGSWYPFYNNPYYNGGYINHQPYNGFSNSPNPYNQAPYTGYYPYNRYNPTQGRRRKRTAKVTNLKQLLGGKRSNL